MENDMIDYNAVLYLDAATESWPMLVRRVFHRLRVYGCVVVRNVVSPSILATIRAAGEPVARRRQAQYQKTENLSNARADWVGDLRYKDMPAPPGAPDMRHYVLYQAFLPTVMPAIAGAYFKQYGVEMLTLPHVACHMRYQSARVASMASGWHQDGNFTMSMDLGRSVQFWLPLDKCGEDAPGMEFIPVGLSGVLPHGDLINAAPATVSIFNPALRFRPVLSPGDVMVFTSESLHGTWSVPEMTQERFNIEFRVFDAKNVYPEMLAEGETRFFPPLLPAAGAGAIWNYILDEPRSDGAS